MLPAGWRERLVVVETASTTPGRGYLLDPHDGVVSKLVAGQEKDYAFVAALVESGLIDPTVLAKRVETLDVKPALRQGLGNRIAHQVRLLSAAVNQHDYPPGHLHPDA